MEDGDASPQQLIPQAWGELGQPQAAKHPRAVPRQGDGSNDLPVPPELNTAGVLKATGNLAFQSEAPHTHLAAQLSLHLPSPGVSNTHSVSQGCSPLPAADSPSRPALPWLPSAFSTVHLSNISCVFWASLHPVLVSFRAAAEPSSQPLEGNCQLHNAALSHPETERFLIKWGLMAVPTEGCLGPRCLTLLLSVNPQVILGPPATQKGIFSPNKSKWSVRHKPNKAPLA